jgi:hypothetical protein
MTCKNWIPTTADVGQALQNAGNAAGQAIDNARSAATNALTGLDRIAPGSSRQPPAEAAPILPPPPSLRLVLDYWEFYRPRSIRLPFEP